MFRAIDGQKDLPPETWVWKSGEFKVFSIFIGAPPISVWIAETSVTPRDVGGKQWFDSEYPLNIGDLYIFSRGPKWYKQYDIVYMIYSGGHQRSFYG